jgi:hypothetical protein
VFLSGCVEGIEWLPDGTGVIYTESPAIGSGSRLMLYDLAKGAKKVLVEDTKTVCEWPSVSPDGHSVCVVDYVVAYDKPSELRVLVYGLDGKEKKKSRTFSWPQAYTDDKTKPPPAHQAYAYCRWTPDKARILVLAGNSLGIYDMLQDKLTELRDHFPFDVNNPIRPDGKFIVTGTGTEPFPKLHLIDGGGWQYELKGKFIFDKEKDVGIIDSYWQKNTLVSFTGRHKFLIDTDAKTVTAEEAKPAGIQLNKMDRIRKVHSFLEAGSALCVIDEMEEKKYGLATKNTRIELQQVALGKRKVLAHDCFLDGEFLRPSPDRKLVAFYMRKVGDAKNEHTLCVVDDTGEFRARVAVPLPPPIPLKGSNQE